jgi:hypothetical protein
MTIYDKEHIVKQGNQKAVMTKKHELVPAKQFQFPFHSTDYMETKAVYSISKMSVTFRIGPVGRVLMRIS